MTPIIFKYELPKDPRAMEYVYTDNQVLRVLDAQMTPDGRVWAWAEVDRDAREKDMLWVLCAWTGQELPSSRPPFVRTLIDQTTGLVWHVYCGTALEEDATE